MYGRERKYLGGLFRRLALERENEIEEGELCKDHVHMLICILPKYSVAQVIGYIKGKSAINIARNFSSRDRNFAGEKFWARGYFVSTIGRDEKLIREYIRRQELEDAKEDGLIQPDLF